MALEALMPVDLSKGILGAPDSPELWEEIIAQIPDDVLSRPNVRILNVACGTGTEARILARRMMALGKTIEQVRESIWVLDKYRIMTQYVADTYGFKNVITADFLQWETDMKFDVVIGNPPYNSSSTSDKTIAGTSGNTVFYRKFIDKMYSIKTEDGTIAMVVQRNGIRYAIEKYGVSKYGLDTSKFWNFTAGFFVATGNDCTAVDITTNTIMRKMYSLDAERRFSNAIGGNYARYKKEGKYSSDEVEGSVYGLVNTPSPDSGPIFSYISGNCQEAGPKIVFKGLESMKSYIVTDLPAHVGSGCTLYFSTLEEADAALKIIRNNKALKYLKKCLNEKTLGHVFRFVREFDYTQIRTGLEYPVEWGLTEEEIAYVEANVK